MYTFLQQTYQHIAHLLLPAHCAHCMRFVAERTSLCSECMYQLTPIASVMVPVTASVSIKVFVIADYKGPLKTLIMHKHWSNRVASVQLGQLIWERTYIAQQPFDTIIPIPLHWTRFAYRGYNQAHEIARVLARKSGKPIIPALTRARRTALQAGLVRTQRQTNIKHAFVCTQNYHQQIYNKHILLVDDLLTTGATVREAAKVLLPYKPASITVVVAARVL